AKSLVPGDENFNFVKTVALGVAGSYMGGAILYLLGKYDSISPAGIFMGVAGGVLTLMIYNKLNQK
ncbi:GlsB/YeaQ/YmgE family stress response membrane protein, partial [bacterium]|nr:GlsB/YeaQ/YmgE family stress response membrane protein [bacterium]